VVHSTEDRFIRKFCRAEFTIFEIPVLLQAGMSHSTKRQTPLIGIFWIYKGAVIGATLPVAEGAVHSEFRVCLLDHVDYWRELQRLNPELRDLEYEEVPRGRILYELTTKKYRVLLDKVLIKPRWKQIILKAYRLPARRTYFLPDPHYTTDSAALDELFQ
jgi:hypothetical protein